MADRDFKGVWIPRNVWLDSRLSMLDKGILIEIDSLDNGESGCYARNEYLARFCQCSERKATEAVSRLIDLGYIRVESFDGRHRVLRSCLPRICEADSQNLRGSLAEIARQTSKKCEADSQKLRHSNTSNNTSNNTGNMSVEKRKRFEPPTVEEVSAYAQEKGWTAFDPDRFVDFYESKGWRVGNQPMRDWKAAARGWVSRDRTKQEQAVKTNPALDYTQREYDKTGYGQWVEMDWRDMD